MYKEHDIALVIERGVAPARNIFSTIVGHSGSHINVSCIRKLSQKVLGKCLSTVLQ